MKLFKILTVSAALLASSAALAGDSMKIFHTGGKSGTTSIIANEYATEFKTKFKTAEASGPGGCLPVMAALKNEKEPVLVLWDSGLLPTDECRPEFTKHAPVATFAAYFFLCTSAENNLTLNDFVKGGQRVALSTPFAFWDKWYREVSTVTKGNHTSVPVGDSGKLVLSLVSKETDWAILNGQRAYAQMQDKKLKCVASTNPSGEAGLPFLGSAIKGFDRAELMLGFSTFVANANTADRAKIESVLTEFHKSPGFQKFLQSGNFVDHTHSPAATKKKFYDNMVRVMSGSQ